MHIVDNEECPGCDSLGPNQVNRPKVGDEDGTWWWKCYTPNCTVGYYNPTTQQWEQRTDNHLLTARQVREQEAATDCVCGGDCNRQPTD
jgi:hypothetical protein